MMEIIAQGLLVLNHCISRSDLLLSCKTTLSSPMCWWLLVLWPSNWLLLLAEYTNRMVNGRRLFCRLDCFIAILLKGNRWSINGWSGRLQYMVKVCLKSLKGPIKGLQVAGYHWYIKLMKKLKIISVVIA